MRMIFALALAGCSASLVPPPNAGHASCKDTEHACSDKTCCGNTEDCGGDTPGCPAGSCCAAGEVVGHARRR